MVLPGRLPLIPLIALIALAAAPAAWSQPLGVFRWQLQPYCNVVTVAVSQNGTIYTLDGTDDQCSASGPRAAVAGDAFPNPDGSIGFGLNIVAAPGGAPVHVEATMSLATLNGTWRDSAGAQGPWVFTPAAGIGGSPRPPGGIGGNAVNPAQVQLRVTGTCPGGQSMTGVNVNGTVNCQTTAAGGDITSVAAGVGLFGGGVSGDVSLGVSFAGSGTTTAAARSDHYHGVGGTSTAVGVDALSASTAGEFNTAAGAGALRALTTGTGNAAAGHQALRDLTSGGFNTAVGHRALLSENGDSNTAVGSAALWQHTLGGYNVAIGEEAMPSYPSGAFNTVVGAIALRVLTSGNQNIALGYRAGDNLQSGSLNMYLGNEGVTSENATVRLGSGALHTRMFLAATRGVTTGVNNAVPVLIDSQGQLGTASSSRRTKEDITDLGAVGLKVQQLRPVQFRYRQAYADGSKPVQYGLIAEEVEEVLPELVAYGNDGQPETVKYQVLPTLLLAEIQRLERARHAADEAFARQASEIAALRAVVAELRAAIERR
jgi:hypothetical protein